MTTPPEETPAGLLSISADRLEYTGAHIHRIGVTVDDLEGVAGYLRELGEHGHGIAHLALDAIANTPRPHPKLPTGRGNTIELYLYHAQNLFGAAQTFAANTYAIAAGLITRPPHDE